MNVYDLIKKRRTIRRFKQQSIDHNLLEQMVDAGRLAPSAANRQPLEFIVVNKQSKLEKIFETLKWAGYIAPKGNPPEGKRPTAYIVVLVNSDVSKIKGAVDAAAAIENMILTALDAGVGSCWIGSVDREKVRGILNIPDNYLIDSVLALGYPDEQPIAEDMADSIKYWKDDKGVLHVPKRKLEKVIHFNCFNDNNL